MPNGDHCLLRPHRRVQEDQDRGDWRQRGLALHPLGLDKHAAQGGRPGRREDPTALRSNA